MMRAALAWLALVFCAALARQPALAEPYLAVREGMKCGACHVNAAGGGMRTAYGNIYAQMQLAATRLAEADAQPWTGELGEHVALGGNLRASAIAIEVPDAETQNLFELDEARLYLLFKPLPRVDLYLDQRVGPGASTNQETWLRLWNAEHDWYVKAGRMYLPYGWRLEDDSAFIRTVPGISFTTPDAGVELGFESGNWSTQFALSNGTGGGPELDGGKQFTLRAARVMPGWRMGASASVNDTDIGNREMFNVFAGVRTGPVAWLAEIDHVRDETDSGETRQRIALLEANWLFRRGHNLKLTLERLDADIDSDGGEQDRASVLWEYFPFEFVQFRTGVRGYDGDAAIATQNRSVFVIQLHGYF